MNKLNWKTVLLGVLTLIVIAIVLVIIFTGGNNTSSTTSPSKFTADLTVTANPGKKAVVDTLTCKGPIASTTGITSGSPADACQIVESKENILTSNGCTNGTRKVVIQGTIGSQDIKRTVYSCDTKTLKQLTPLLPAAAVSSANTDRNGLFFVSHKNNLTVSLTEPTSAVILKEILGKKVSIVCDTSDGKWKTSLTWPASAKQIVVHPHGAPKKCSFEVKGQVLAEATP